MPLISVVICTFNRAPLLATALRSACAQNMASTNFEIIVVDNKSTDDTATVVADFADQHPNVRYVYEPVQGLSAARNRGWQEARGDYIAYVDDDCKVPADWLQVAQDVIDREAPVEFGGPSLAYFAGAKPCWWKDQYDRDHTLDTDLPLGYLPPEREIYGLNMFLKRTIFDIVGGFDTSFGVYAGKLAYGEETEMHARIRKSFPDHRAYFEPKLFVYHLVRPEKMSPWWRLESAYRHGQAGYRITPPQDRSLPTWQCIVLPVYVALLFTYVMLASLPWRSQTRFPYWQNRVYEASHLYLCVWRLGSVSAAMSDHVSRLLGSREEHAA